MPQWIEAPTVTPDAVARGVSTMSPGGGKEIYFDSSSQRAQYDSAGAPQVPVTDPAYVPEIVTAAPSPEALAQTLPPDVLKAMANGGTPSAESIRALITSQPPKIVSTAQPVYGAPSSAAVELTIPVGNGVTARVTFTAQPAQIHWRKLIRHLEIEAEETDDERAKRETPDLAKLAAEALERQRGLNLRTKQPAGEAVVTRPLKRRKRKDDGSAPESGQS